MLKFIKTFYDRAGKQPGFLPQNDASGLEPAWMTFTTIRSSGVTETKLQDNDLKLIEDPQEGIRWLRVVGVHDSDLLERIGEQYQLNRLTLEDIANVGHRPKLELFEDKALIIAKLLTMDNGGAADPGHVALIMGNDWLVSFEDRPVPVFEEVRQRILDNTGRFLERGVGYLLYALIDATVDLNFGMLDQIGTQLAEMEDKLEHRITREALLTAYSLRRELILLRRWTGPLKDIVQQLHGGAVPQISSDTRVFLRDTLDHCEQLIDAAGAYDEMAEAMINTHISASGQRSTEVMQTLTVIATVFIPLTFIVGIYGMNFKFMPELDWKWGYFVVWAIMLATVAMMIRFFKRRGWF